MWRKRGTAVVLFVLVGILAWVPAAWAQTTGRIGGKIVDATGGALPGVTVTVSSPALQGLRTTVTDGAGEYRFPTLPPGKYILKAELSGFKTVEQPDLVVGIDRTVDVNLSMSVGNVSESVTVEGAAPVIDIRSTTTGLNANSEFFAKLPVRRDFYAIAQLAPGVSMDNSATNDAGTTFAGSTGAENSYIVEGLNTTGIYLGNRGKTLNQDFVQEVEVKTGGLPAEYGRMTGGVINVLTKSGSNQFHGSFFGFAEGGGLQANDATASNRPEWQTTVGNVAHLWDTGVSLGGYMVKDRLWFFGAYNGQQQRTETTFIRDLTGDAPGSLPMGSSAPTTTNTQLYSAKVTFKVANNHTIVFSGFGDPAKTTGALISQWILAGPPSTWDGTENTGGNDTVLRYDGVLSSTSYVRAQYARHNEKDLIGGAGRNIPQTQNQRVSPPAYTGGFGYFEDLHFARDVYKVDFSKMFPANEIKVGFDVEKVTSNLDRYQGGAGQRVYLMQTEVDGVMVPYVRHRYYVDGNAPGYSRDDPTTWRILLPLNTRPGNRNYSIYAQDNVKLGRLALNLGLRWEKQEMLDPTGAVALRLNKNWAPRLGGIFDATGNGKTKIYGNWGRFYEAIPMDMGVRSFGGELYTFAYNFDPNPASLVPDPAAPARSQIYGGSTEPVDPLLTGQYIDETLVGFERELGKDLTLGVRYAHRKLGNVIEDFLIPAQGEYFIANPGRGIGAEFSDYAQSKTIPAPKARRVYDSVQLTARKRYTNGWQVMASYVWSKLEGNYDGTFQVSTGQLDPNINSAYDYSDFLVNANGRLSNDRTHFIKIDGTYELQKGPAKGLSLGAGMYAASGFPLNAYGFSVGYQSWEYYLVPRGSLGRGPWEYEGNLHVAYPFSLGKSMRLEPIVDVFNLLNRQALRMYDQRYNLMPDGACAGVPEAICNGDGGLLSVGNTLTPAGSVTREMATNPDFLKKGTLFTGQRSIRFGVRFTF